MKSITNKADFLNFWNKEATEFDTLHSHQIFFDENMIFKTFLCYKNQLKNFQKHNKATDFITSVNGSLTLMVSLTDDNIDIFHYIHNRFNEFNIKLKIIAYQLIKTTSLGLLVPRPIQKQKIDGDFLIRDDNSILQWIVLDDMLIISSNGHCSSIAYCQDIELLLNRILTNKIVNIKDFQQDKSLVVIHKLYQWGCLVCTTH